MTALQERKAKLEVLEKGTLINRLVKAEDRTEELKTVIKRYEHEEKRLKEELNNERHARKIAERRLRFIGLKPERLIVEYGKFEETQYNGPVLVSESITAFDWEVQAVDDGEGEWYVLTGIGSDYEEFAFENVASYLTPNGINDLYPEKDTDEESEDE